MPSTGWGLPPAAAAGANMEYVIAHSFSQFQHEKQLPQMTSRLKALEVGLAVQRCSAGAASYEGGLVWDFGCIV